MDFIEQMKAHVRDLMSRPDFSLGGGASPQPRPLVWSKWPKSQREKVKRVPADFHPLYAQAEHVNLNWTYFNPAFSPQAVEGSVTSQSLSSLFYQGGEVYYQGSKRVALEGFWDAQLPEERQAYYSQYYIFDNLLHNTQTLWRQGSERVELALYLGQDRLHPLPFTPLEYAETGLALRFIELWQLLFIPEDQQPEYAEALGTVAAQVRHLFPDAAHLIPTHVAARYPAPAPLPGPDYRTLFEHTVARLRAVPEVRFFEQPALRPGASLGVFERARRELSFALPAEVRAFYQQLNGSRLYWQLDRPDIVQTAGDPVEGTLRFWPLEQVLAGKRWLSRRPLTDPPHLGDFWDDEHQDSVPGLDEFRPFETLLSGTPMPGFALPAAPDEPVQMLLLAGLHHDDLVPLQVSFTDYLAADFAAAGVTDWQGYYWEEYARVGDEPAWVAHVVPALHALGLDPEQVLRYRPNQ